MQPTGYLERILGIICSVFDAYSAVIILPSKGKDEFHIAAKFSLGDKIRPNASIKSGKGLVGWLIRNNRPLLINNVDRKRNKLGYYTTGDEPKVKAFMGCPIPKMSGALCLDSTRQFSFSEKDQKILQLFAELIRDLFSRFHQVEEGLSGVEYYQTLTFILSLKRRISKWAPFREQLLHLLSEASDFEYAFLCIADPEGERYYIEGATLPLMPDKDAEKGFPIGSGVLGWIFKNDKPVVSGEEDSGGSPLFGRDVATPEFASTICLPLMYHRKTRAVLCLASEQAREVSDPLKDFVASVADHLCLFLENLYLRSRLEQLADD